MYFMQLNFSIIILRNIELMHQSQYPYHFYITNLDKFI